MSRLLVLGAVFTLLVSGCGGDGGEEATGPCSADAVQSCACESGDTGSRRCEAGQWGPCECGVVVDVQDANEPDAGEPDAGEPDADESDVPPFDSGDDGGGDAGGEDSADADVSPVDTRPDDTGPDDATPSDVRDTVADDAGDTSTLPPIPELLPPLPCDDLRSVCCEPSGFAAQRGTPCDDFRVWDARCGTDGTYAEYRYGVPGCAGDEVRCSADREDVAWGDWQRIDCACDDAGSGPRCALGELGDGQGSSTTPTQPAGSACAPELRGESPTICYEGVVARWADGFRWLEGTCASVEERGVPVSELTSFFVEDSCSARDDLPGPTLDQCLHTADGEVSCVWREDRCTDSGSEVCCNNETGRALPDGTPCGGNLIISQSYCDGGRVLRDVTRAHCRSGSCTPDSYIDEFGGRRGTYPVLETVVVEDCRSGDRDCIEGVGDQASFAMCVPAGIECASGECCDISTGLFVPAGTTCASSTGGFRSACADEATLVSTSYRPTCNGESAECDPLGEIRSVRELACGAGESCDATIVEQLGRCVADSERCDPSAVCCTDSGFFAPEGSDCSTTVLSVSGVCTTNPQIAENTSRRPGCVGTAAGPDACSTAPEYQTRVPARDVCSPSERCSVGPDSVARCLPLGTSFCTSGECCNTSIGLGFGPGHPCSETPVAEQLRCSADGVNLERREAVPGCTGDAVTCSSMPAHLAWSAWETVQGCADGCTELSAVAAECVGGALACEAGRCCEAGVVRPVGASCGVTASFQWACISGDAWARPSTFECDGSGAECPFDPLRVTAGEWVLDEACEHGCTVSTDGRARCEPPPSGGGGEPPAYRCGTPCLLGGICGAGRTCFDGTCLPDECAFCFGIGEACDYNPDPCGFASCAGGGGPAPETGGGGGTPGDTGCNPAAGVLRRSGFTAGGVEIETMEIQYLFDSFIGEPLREVSWRYWTSPADSQVSASARVYVAVRDDAGRTWYSVEEPVLPAAEGRWSPSATESPPWAQLFCGGPTNPTTCMPASDAAALHDAGFGGTGFVVHVP